MLNHKKKVSFTPDTGGLWPWSDWGLSSWIIIICECQDNENKTVWLIFEQIKTWQQVVMPPCLSSPHTMIWEIVIAPRPWQRAPGLSFSGAHQKHYLFPGIYTLLMSTCFLFNQQPWTALFFLTNGSTGIIFMLLNFQRMLLTQTGARMKNCLSQLSCGQ